MDSDGHKNIDVFFEATRGTEVLCYFHLSQYISMYCTSIDAIKINKDINKKFRKCCSTEAHMHLGW